MGVSWIQKVRLLHLVLVSIGVTTLLYFVAFVPSLPVIIARTGNQLFNFVYYSNTNRNTSQQQETASTPDLTKAFLVASIYQAGHIAVNSHICSEDLGKELKLLIVITSAPHHQSARMAIRKTWGRCGARQDVAVAFMLGTTTGGNGALRQLIEEEATLYGDIIIGKFIDTYASLPLKTISMLEWVDTYCLKAAFLFKTDDDVFINVPKLLAFIDEHSPDERSIYGCLAHNYWAGQDKTSKYYISHEQYAQAMFPDFIFGAAYLLPARLANELYTAALQHTYVKLEDVFLTGIVAPSLNIKRVDVPNFNTNKPNRNLLTPGLVQQWFTIHKVYGSEQFELWYMLDVDRLKCI